MAALQRPWIAGEARRCVCPYVQHRVALHYGGRRGTLVAAGTIFKVAGGTVTTYKN